MHNPVATYRIQFHENFTLADAEKLLPYLQKLGISTLYASPIFEATPGSTHGYDGVDPHRINPEIGTEEQLRDICTRLKEQGINWVQDIVPNHMAYHPNNTWLMDVLEKGELSAYASFFDVAWTSQLYNGRIMVPFLGSTLEEVIQNGELKVKYQADRLRLYLSYYDSDYPLNLRSYATILNSGKKKKSEAINQLLEKLDEIHKEDESTAFSSRWEEFLQQFASLLKNKTTGSYIESCIKAVNQDPDAISKIAEEQTYRLCHWQETDKKITFRRFFTVNSLICLNIQNPEVFQTYHQFINTLLQDDIFQGIRIDHIDGLFDPSGYLQQLRELAGEEKYIVVEKILEPGEDLPNYWPIQGATGYEFLSDVNNLFTNRESKKSFTDYYARLVGNEASAHDQIHDKKAYILFEHMAGELDNLYHLFIELNLADEKALSKVDPEILKRAIGEVLIQCPVYRYYGNSLPLDEEETTAVTEIFNNIRKNKKELVPGINLLEEAILKKPAKAKKEEHKNALLFYQRIMQFTGPLMAKGVEDTLMYTYNRFIGHNEVGDSPEAFGLTPEEFHQKMVDRQKNWPLALNTTSTHDTKRGEDVRIRLNVLTDLADEWLEKVQEWKKQSGDLKQNGAPDDNDEYLIYQTLIGALPMPGEDEDQFGERIQEYLQKALREAKKNSNWTTPNEEYETATKAFAKGLLDQSKPFWKSFAPFHQKVADYGIVNSLSQVLLKFTCPGVPDVYQGTELWDLSLVDPDNRRAVDYKKRQQWLDDLDAQDLNKQEEVWQDLWQNRSNAKIKLWLTHTLLNERKRNADIFAKGDYLPLEVSGEYKDNIIAFARSYQQTCYLIVVPLHLAQLCKQQGKEVLELDWKDTTITLPKDIPTEWQHLLLKTEGTAEKELPVNGLFTTVPIAVLKFKAKNERGAGILLHITSLPSPFGLGDLGPEAKAFADFLYRTGQKYWQLLPLNPTEQGQAHSPYSALSSRAGNPLLISPELLADAGLLDPKDFKKYRLPQKDQADYAEAERIKTELFEIAWKNYKDGEFATMKQQFLDFCRQEALWLDDFALFIVLKDKNGGKPWFEWPEEFKQRDKKVLEKLKAEQADQFEKTRWLQFIFLSQWKRLRTYCNNRGIQLFGDMPFYTSYDSVDVWANREIFSLDKEGNMTGIAGVPPDFFSEDGQLWGMPVFEWDVLKKQNYRWWIERLIKNIELFDIVRLDHFRAFADYWVVPAGEKTARRGEWKLGPGSEFFNQVKKEMGGLPFIAEDLGDVSPIVLELRDEFELPGMKVIQFAFDESMPQSIFIPHNFTPNFVAYTGTHDNNTILGWYNQEGKEDKKRMDKYLGRVLERDEIAPAMCRMAFASVAKIAIIPLQDLLGLDEKSRMNYPGEGEGNWLWRLKPGQLTKEAEKQLLEWTRIYNRD
ncbi:malto-oligosyltrehalose synthase [Telluribacter sp.]|jgi:malto-oligosyltrehalose synthase/4-alpha-glucanotransferase|uniref:malto-oligosyltrehalose synthase n=1 Tax=Telluribacter sp. TaxID=1978767 RepID=UPI002E0D942E|nr:malto-oligosyltrehalose synthase [Telluribacter sp.]